MTEKCKSGCVTTRCCIAFMLFTASCCSYMLRVNMSVTILVMANSHNVTDIGTQRENTSYGPRQNWSELVQCSILAGYGYGYILMQIPGNAMVKVISSRFLVFMSLLIMSISTALIPLAAASHYGYVLAARIIIGLAGGAMFPALHKVITKWAPPEERRKFACALLGGTFGTVIALPVCCVIICLLGWPCSFYIFAGTTAVMSLFWVTFVSDSPESHPCISPEERNYIVQSLKEQSRTSTRTLPVCKMLSSVPFLALVILHFGNLWGLFFILTLGPKYLMDILRCNFLECGIYCSIPYIARFILGFLFGTVVGHILDHEQVSTVEVRKSFVVFSHMIPGCMLIIVGFTRTNKIIGIVSFVLTLAFNGAATVTNLANHHDLAPNFAGPLYSVMNAVGSTSSFIIPQMTGVILDTENSCFHWQLIIYVTSGMYIVSGLIFCLFGSAEQQEWSK